MPPSSWQLVCGLLFYGLLLLALPVASSSTVDDGVSARESGSWVQRFENPDEMYAEGGHWHVDNEVCVRDVGYFVPDVSKPGPNDTITIYSHKRVRFLRSQGGAVLEACRCIDCTCIDAHSYLAGEIGNVSGSALVSGGCYPYGTFSVKMTAPKSVSNPTAADGMKSLFLMNGPGSKREQRRFSFEYDYHTFGRDVVHLSYVNMIRGRLRLFTQSVNMLPPLISGKAEDTTVEYSVEWNPNYFQWKVNQQVVWRATAIIPTGCVTPMILLFGGKGYQGETFFMRVEEVSYTPFSNTTATR